MGFWNWLKDNFGGKNPEEKIRQWRTEISELQLVARKTKNRSEKTACYEKIKSLREKIKKWDVALKKY